MKKKFSVWFENLNVKDLCDLQQGMHCDLLEQDAKQRIEARVFQTIRIAKNDAQKVKTGHGWRKAVIIMAACLVLLLTGSVSMIAYTVEAEEYRQAVQFFNEHDLSIEGLTRTEIKTVYRDIIMESFTYSKTAVVIENSLLRENVSGYEIPQENPSPEDIENLWNYKNYYDRIGAAIDEPNCRYSYSAVYRTDEKLGFDVYEKSIVEKHRGDTLLWSVDITDFEVYDCQAVSDGVIAYGATPTWSSHQKRSAWLAKIDRDGQIQWKQELGHGFNHASIEAVLENEDGSYTVFSRGDLQFFCVSQLSADGKEILFHRTEVGNYGIWNVAHLGDGYVVQLGSYSANEQAKIVKVDRTGHITESFVYKEDRICYHITDMLEYNGQIYLSAYAVPIPEDAEQSGAGWHELSAVIDYLFENSILQIPEEKLTPMVRDQYTAMLLVCDPNAGTPLEFYSVKGSLGGRLLKNTRGELEWDVESITTTFFSPMTSSFTVGGTCQVFRYTFDVNGALIQQKTTEEFLPFRR